MKVIKPDQNAKVLPLSLFFDEALAAVEQEPLEIKQAVINASSALKIETLRLQDDGVVMSPSELQTHLAEFYDQNAFCRAEVEAYGVTPSPLKGQESGAETENHWDFLLSAGQPDPDDQDSKGPSGPKL